MAKLFPTKQTFVDEKLSNGEQIVITRVKLLSSSSDHVDLPDTALDTALLQSTKTTSDPTFYLTRADSQLSIDGGTVGDEHVIVSRHSGMINFGKGDNPDGGL